MTIQLEEHFSNFVRRIVMADQITKDQCTSVEEASKILGVSSATLYNYMNILNVQRLRFGFDRRTYISNSELKRIQVFVKTNRG